MSNFGLTYEEIKDRAPAVFEDYPASTVHQTKYKLIKTGDIIEPMLDKGWVVSDAQQRNTRKNEWKDKTYHFIRMKHEDIKIGDDYLELLISNSHNATSSFKIQLAILRMVCANGLTVGTDLVSPLVLQHKGLSQMFMSKMAQMYATMMAGTVTEGVEAMKRTQINREQVLELARKAAYAKHKDDYEIDINGICLPRRYEDQEMNVWTQYNVVQENIINGTYQIKGEKGWRNARRVHSPASNIDINTKMFENAMELVS